MTSSVQTVEAAAVAFPSDAIPPTVRDIGLLIGVLKSGAGDTIELNLDWFSDPAPYLLDIPKDRAGILNLLRDLLGEPIDGPPAGYDWYPISWAGKPSGVFAVLPKSGDKTSPVGVGLWHPFTKDTDAVQIGASLHVPLFDLPIGNPVIVTGSATDPVVVALEVVDTKQRFSSGASTFSGLEFAGNITFSSDPSFELSFTDLDPPAPQSTVNTLAGLLAAIEDISNWANAILANATVKGWLDTAIPTTTKKIGDVLVDLALLKGGGSGAYTFGDFSSFENKTPIEIAEELVAETLSILASREDPVVAIGKGGIYITGEEVETGVTDYGLRLQIPDIGAKTEPAGGSAASAMAGEGNGTAPPEANGPQLVLQLGKYLTGESDDTNWVDRADKAGTFSKPGVSVYFIRETASTPSFRPRVELVSIGLDFTGGNDKPLVDVSGLTLGGFEPRILLSLDFEDLSKIPWGFAVRVDKFGLPMGSGLASSSSSNPVAQNLLSSGNGESGGSAANGAEGAGADSEKIAPAFSAAIAKIFDPTNDTEFGLQLYSADDQPTDQVMLPINRSFGPLECKQIGVGWPQENEARILSMLFDGGIKTSALSVDLQGLSVGIPITEPGDLSKYEFGLTGLDFALTAGTVEISGGLLESKITVDGQEITAYNGQALIKAGVWSIQALGSWASLNGHPSLFVFAFIDAPIGGPPVFFVTGLSAGFGYNRSLEIPAIDKVQEFPLLAGLSDPSAIGGADATPGEALDKLNEYVPPAQGVNWVAAGVQFTSFELINSNALLIIEFGREFEIALLGLSRIKLPPVGDLTFAYVELALEVIFAPDEGVFSAQAVLTANSYVLDQACHLTGGFAFFTWFGRNEHAGDFVLTVGGYGPFFDKPPWYPAEPRLGFNWAVSSDVTIKGGAYFALTPSCVMGGGSLDIEFAAGPVRAWFTAHADFLIQWRPFYFIASIGVSIGVAIKVDILFIKGTIKLELGADLSIWGPPTGGHVEIHLWIISFGISFGSKLGAGQDYLAFDDFKQLLPSDKKPAEQPARLMAAGIRAAAELTAEPAVPLENVCRIVLNAGQAHQQSPPDRWLVRADEFTFTVQTAFPLTELDLVGPTATTKVTPVDSGYYVGVRPMGISTTDSVMTVTVTYEPGTPSSEISDLDTAWLWSQKLAAVPEATWGTPIPSGQTPPAAANLLAGRLVGLQNVTPAFVVPVGPPAIPEANLASDPINPDDSDYLPFPGTVQTNQPESSPTSTASIASTISAAATVANRTALFGALAALGYDAGANGSTQAMADNAGESYPSPPLIGQPVAAAGGVR